MAKPVLRSRKSSFHASHERAEKASPRRADRRAATFASAATVVLIVDDNADVREAYRYMLEEDHFQVIEAPDADVALKLLKAQKIDVLLTDLFMDGSIDGVGLVHAVRAQARRPAIIAMSGLPHVAYRSSLHAAQALGADATLTKP